MNNWTDSSHESEVWNRILVVESVWKLWSQSGSHGPSNCSHCALLRHRCVLQLCPAWGPCWLYRHDLRFAWNIRRRCLIPKCCQMFNYGSFFIEVHMTDWDAVACSVVRRSKMLLPCVGNLKYIAVQAENLPILAAEEQDTEPHS